MADIEIKEIFLDDANFWDTIVDRSPQGTIFHKYHFLKTVEKHTKSKLHFIVGYLGNEIIAAIPFFRIKRNFKMIVLSPVNSAFIQNLGPLFPDYDALKQDKKEFYFREFQRELDSYLEKKFKATEIIIITSPHLIDARPFVWNNYKIIPKYNYIKNIENLDIVWADFKKQLRKNIEKANKSGIIIREGNLGDLQKISKSISGRLEEQNIILKTSNDYLIDLYKLFFPSNLRIFVAENQGIFVSGIVITAYKNKISIWIGATQTDLKGIYPVDLLQWKIIEWGHNNGYQYCEIFGANMPKISYFKSRYNFDLDLYWNAKKDKRFEYFDKCKKYLGFLRKKFIGILPDFEKGNGDN